MHLSKLDFKRNTNVGGMVGRSCCVGFHLDFCIDRLQAAGVKIRNRTGDERLDRKDNDKLEIITR